VKQYLTRKAKLETDITAFWILSKMCFASTKLWNAACFESRKQWNETGKIPSGFDLQKQLQKLYWYSMMPAHSSQDAIHKLGEAYMSWFRLRKKDTTARPPGFRKKEILSSFVLKKAYFRIENGKLRISIPKKLKEELKYPHRFLHLNFHLDKPIVGKPQEVEIIPMDGYFMAHIKCLIPEPEWKTEGQVKAIDVGICNIAVTANEDGTTKIYNGGEILSELRYFNKRIGALQKKVTKKSKDEQKWSDRLSELSRKRTRRIRHMLHSITRSIAEDCEKEGVKEVVIGELKGIKKDENGKGRNWGRNSQKLHQAPIRLFINQLRYKLYLRGIRMVEIDERGTSSKLCSHCGSGNVSRVERGLFHCRDCGVWLNADVNGARNILQRYLRNGSETSARSSGCLAHPLASRWDEHQWVVA